MTPEVLTAAKSKLAAAKKAASGDPLAAKRVEFLEQGLTEAELAVTCRRAQIELEKTKSPENRRAFRAAWEKLEHYRNSIENKFVLDVGKARFREQTGCGWPKK